MPTESVAFLFTDMVGSTELYQSVPPDVGDELRRSHLALLRNATAGSGGSEVKNLGDGIMAVFPSASAALASAAAMQQAVELDNRNREHYVGLRIGLSAGEVVHEEDDYFGDAVVEAARLCAMCEGGQILATEIVRVMAGRRSPTEFRSLGLLTLKGILDPVRVDEVRWEPPPPARTDIPFPARLAAVTGTAVDIVGRDAELATLAAAAKRAFSGEGREVVMVSGEPGQGKTTLVAQAAQLAFDGGACVLFGHSEEGLSTPYGLFAEAFSGYAAHARDDAFVELLEAHGSEWSRLVPGFLERAPGLASSKATDADAERYLLFAGAIALLSGMSRREPIVLVLDDLQWADPGSLALLHHLTSAHEHRLRVLVTGVFRSSELGQSPGLRDTLAQLWRHPGVSRIELESLDVTAVESLLEVATSGALDASASGFAELVHRETGGNAFFVTEALRHLLDTGAIPVETGDLRADADVFSGVELPTSVREVIGARVARLGPSVGRILSTAAVIGRDFDLDLLGRATELPTEELLDALDTACAAALVAEVDGPAGRYTFSHALVPRTLADDVGSARRAYLHERVAKALEDLSAPDRDARAGELAHHWVAAPRPGNIEQAIRSSHRAATLAMDSLAPGDAALHFATALELCTGVRDTGARARAQPPPRPSPGSTHARGDRIEDGRGAAAGSACG
jgi:class 3 adenylate cyclase